MSLGKELSELKIGDEVAVQDRFGLRIATITSETKLMWCVGADKFSKKTGRMYGRDGYRLDAMSDYWRGRVARSILESAVYRAGKELQSWFKRVPDDALNRMLSFFKAELLLAKQVEEASNCSEIPNS
jgi:hypothetical protein